jgi:hypothetical protein
MYNIPKAKCCMLFENLITMIVTTEVTHQHGGDNANS